VLKIQPVVIKDMLQFPRTQTTKKNIYNIT